MFNAFLTSGKRTTYVIYILFVSDFTKSFFVNLSIVLKSDTTIFPGNDNWGLKIYIPPNKVRCLFSYNYYSLFILLFI